MFLLALIGLVLAAPTIEVPVDGSRDAARTVRRLGDLGLSASVVRVAGQVRVRLDVAPESVVAAGEVADRIARELGRGAIVLDGTGGTPPPARSVPTQAGLAERIATAPTVSFSFVRRVPRGVVEHLWMRDRDRIAVSIQASEGDLVSSRLLWLDDQAWLWTEQGRQTASPERIREWADLLSPMALLDAAFEAGFGTPVQPAPGCVERGTRSLCIGPVEAIPAEGVVFEDLLRTAEGQWLPGVITWYSAEELQDRVELRSVAFPDRLEQSWFNPDFTGLSLDP